MSSLTNAGFGCLENYISDVAVTVTVGLGYYLFKGLKRKNEDFSDPESGLKSLKGKLEGALERWNYAKSIEEYNELIKNSYTKDGIEDPFKIINLMNKNGILPNIDTYNALLLNCYSKNNSTYAELLKEEILDNCGPVTPNNFTLNVLIKGLNLKYKNLRRELVKANPNFNKEELFLKFDSELILLLKTLEDRNIYMDLIGQNTILDSLVDQGRLNEAWAQYTSMKKKFKPDMYTFSTILKGIKRTPELSCDWLDKAFMILNEAKITNEIDETFLNTLLDSCVKFNRIDKAENLFKDFENFGKKKTLTEHSYCIMIKGYSKVYKMQKAEEIFNEIKNIMKEKEQKLSIVTYGAIMNCYTRCKNISQAEEILKEMEKENIEINPYIYSTLINGYKMNRKYEKAIEVFEKIIANYKNKENLNKSLDSIKSAENKDHDNSFNSFDENMQNPEKCMNIVFFNSILDCCVEANKIEKMEEIFAFLEEEQSKESFAKIDVITYSILIKGYAKGNKISKVKEIYEKISGRKEFKLDEMLYNTILDCYAKENDEVSAMKMYEEMKSNKIKVSVVTFGVLIKLYLNMGRSEKAFELFEENLTNEIKPSVVIYQMLIKNLIKTQLKIEEAISLFKKMQKNGTTPDQNIYELIIKGCLENDKIKQAGEFVLEALNQKIKVENFLIANFTEKFEENTTSNFSEKEKSSFVPKLIEAITTKSQNVELNSLKILKQINQKIKAEKEKMKGASIYGNTTPNTSIYSSVPAANNSEEKKSVGPYNFDSNNGISDLKGFYKNYITVTDKPKEKEAEVKKPEANTLSKSLKPLIKESAPVYIPTKFRNSENTIAKPTENKEKENINSVSPKSNYRFTNPNENSYSPKSNNSYSSNNSNSHSPKYYNSNRSDTSNSPRGNYNNYNSNNNNNFQRKNFNPAKTYTQEKSIYG